MKPFALALALAVVALLFLGCGGAPVESQTAAAPQQPAAPPSAGDKTSCADATECANRGVAASDAGDAAAAFAWFGKSCDLGGATGCLGAAMAHYEGKGAAKDPARAFELFSKACSLGSGESCNNVGALLWVGEDVPQDRDAALAHFRLGCDKGHAPACKAVEIVVSQDTSGGAAAGTELSVDSLTVNGMTVKDLHCGLESLGLMTSVELVTAIAGLKAELDKCAPKGDAPIVSFKLDGASVQNVVVDGGASDKVRRCVGKVAAKITSGLKGECFATFLIGAEAGSAAAYEKTRLHKQ